MHHPSVLWHIIPLKLSSWNIICLWQKEPINVQLFRLLSALMKVHSISRAIFETTRSGFIQIHCSVSWKITRLYFLAQTSYTLDKKSSSKRNFHTFWVLVKFHEIPVIFETTSQFFFKRSITLSWEITLLYHKVSLYMNWTKGAHQSLKFQTFECSRQHKFHQICALIGSFCWKYIEFQLKKYWGVISHDTAERCKIWRKTDLFQ